jgi:16S rRNA (cytosine967-C5)-methyltransferase
VALGVLARVEDDGAFANIALSPQLERSNLDQRDRALVTDLVYGNIRMRRACEFLIGRFLSDQPPPAAMRALSLGVYQIAFRPDIPSYAAVSATVGAAPKRYRGLVNAVLRRVSSAPIEFPDIATELSYPDWIVDTLTEDHGLDAAKAVLASMNEAAVSHVRPDGYVQDLASQWVADHLAALLLDGGNPHGESATVVDLCAAPGGKATALAARDGLWVAAVDKRTSRVALLESNIESLGQRDAAVIAADALMAPVRPGAAAGVLLDAPCSGLGVLRRRADARWRVDESAPERLAALQRDLVDAAVPLLAPGGVLLYSVCTLTALESIGIDDHLRAAHPELVAIEAPGEPWMAWGRGAILLPQAVGTDGMAMFAYRLAH